MSASRRRHLSQNATEELLGDWAVSDPAGSAADRDALASLLAVATAPAHDRELTGEAAAVAAFRQALSSPASRQRRPSMSVTKLLVAKAVLAAVGVTGGGVALAAATGHLPASLTGGSSATSSASAAATPSASGDSASHPTASPSPSLRGLCQAYTAKVGSNPGKALGDPAFSALITSAGGKSNVASFCADLLATKPGNAPTSHPTGKPSSLPSTANTTHPTGMPSMVPSSHATGSTSNATGSAGNAGQPGTAGQPTGAPSSHP